MTHVFWNGKRKEMNQHSKYKTSQLRLYSFVNYYLSGLQHGLQTAHCVGELATSVLAEREHPEAASLFKSWASDHKTIIILNGGNSGGLNNLYYALTPLAAKLKLPLTRFHEDAVSLNNALTSVAIVLPDHIYDAELPDDLYLTKDGDKSLDRMFSKDGLELTQEELKVKEIIYEYNLA